MKFGIKIESDQIESVEKMVGTISGARFETLLKDGAKEHGVYICCTGSFGSYLRCKKIFGKDRVHKWNW